MEEQAAGPSFMGGIARKALALGVLLIAAWVLFKVVIGVVAAVAWIVVIVLAVMAVLWATSILRR